MSELLVEIHVPLVATAGDAGDAADLSWIDDVEELLFGLEDQGRGEVYDDGEEFGDEYVFFVWNAPEIDLVGIARVPGQTGLDWGHAFAAITSGPAAALGLDGEIGSLRPGRRADVVVWDGDPLELASYPQAVFIDGVQQPLTNRQTRLRDRYLLPNEGALPKAYER